MSTRSYGQFCGLTRGADLLGGRWTLPLVRDLLLGPARFSDLLAGFPGISTNQLSTRLKEMEADGIIRRVLAPRGTRYELTEWGRALEPVITEIGRWGAARMEQPAEGEIVTEAGLASSLRT
jgi:DNA-binding HxlR family transcriptional regulator